MERTPAKNLETESSDSDEENNSAFLQEPMLNEFDGTLKELSSNEIGNLEPIEFSAGIDWKKAFTLPIEIEPLYTVYVST